MKLIEQAFLFVKFFIAQRENKKIINCRFCWKGHKQGFTLAEVLITIAIIGVVAALVIPNVWRKYQNVQFVSGLQKGVSTINNAFTGVLAVEEAPELSDTDLLKSISYMYICYLSTRSEQSGIITNCAPFYANLHKYLKFSLADIPSSYVLHTLSGYDNGLFIQGYQEGTLHATSGGKVVQLPDGMLIMGTILRDADYMGSLKTSDSVIRSNGGQLFRVAGFIYIDVNGFKNPNTLGRDIFSFLLGNDGKLYPYEGKNYAIFMNAYTDAEHYGWRGHYDECGTPGKSDVVEQKATGSACAARVIEEGWQMNY